jgi:glycerophosphoryl diester phosphodiesterase
MDLSHIQLVAHRGEHDLAPENTIKAFELALKQGANALEADVRLCSSGEVVLFHDFTLSRHFNDRRKVKNCKLEELRSLTFENEEYKHKDRIATLDEFLESYKNTVPLNIDIKTYMVPNRRLCIKVLATINRHNMQDQVWISSFNPMDLYFLKATRPSIRTGYLYNSLGMIHFFIDILLKSDAWHPHHSQVSPGFFKFAERLGKDVYIWTVNDEPVLEKFINHKFHGIITDSLFRQKSLQK